MLITELMSGLIGRKLRDEEAHVLRHLSARGMAKLNSDLSRGVHPQLTLIEFQIVFRLMEDRRRVILNGLSPKAQMAMLHTKRFVTTEEMIFLRSCCRNNKFAFPLDKNGFVREDQDLEDCAAAFAHVQLQLHAPTCLAAAEGSTLDATKSEKKVFVSQLVTTTVPNEQRSEGVCCSPTVVRTRSKNSIVVGLNPALCWFSEMPLDPPLDISSAEASRLLASISPSPRRNGSRHSPEPNSTATAPLASLPSLWAHPLADDDGGGLDQWLTETTSFIVSVSSDELQKSAQLLLHPQPPPPPLDACSLQGISDESLSRQTGGGCCLQSPPFPTPLETNDGGRISEYSPAVRHCDAREVRFSFDQPIILGPSLSKASSTKISPRRAEGKVGSVMRRLPTMIAAKLSSLMIPRPTAPCV